MGVNSARVQAARRRNRTRLAEAGARGNTNAEWADQHAPVLRCNVRREGAKSVWARVSAHRRWRGYCMRLLSAFCIGIYRRTASLRAGTSAGSQFLIYQNLLIDILEVKAGFSRQRRRAGKTKKSRPLGTGYSRRCSAEVYVNRDPRARRSSYRHAAPTARHACRRDPPACAAPAPMTPACR